MPEFSPSSAHTAIAPVVVKPSGLNCEAELFLGPNETTKVATSGLVAFTSTGASQDISLPVTMPSADGTYHVFIDVYAEGILIAAYQAIEDVVISPPVPLAPCVYCGATFTSEAALVSHMNANHAGKPYLIYAYAQASVSSGGTLGIGYKVYTPTVPSGDRAYFFTFYIPDFPVWEPYNGAYIDLRGDTPEGFYEGGAAMRVAYSIGGWPPKFVNIPRGTYSLYSKCRHLADVGEREWATIKTFWKDVDTGQTITVV